MQSPREFSWLNELNVQVAYGDYPDAAPSEVFVLRVEDPQLEGLPWDDDAFVTELEPLTWAQSEDGMRYQVPYELSVRKGHFSWGADGATAGLFLYIAQHFTEGSLGAVGGAATLAALKRLKDKLPGKDGEERFLSTRDELEEYGRWSVQAAYREWIADDEELPLLRESLTDDEWTGTFRDGAGNHYDVTLRPSEGRPYRVQIGRRASHPGNEEPGEA